MKIRHMALALATLGLLAAGAATAAPMHRGWHGDGLEILHGIDLTDAQKTQVHEIMKTNWAQMKPVMQQMRSIHEQIETTLLTPGSVTQDQLNPLVQQEQQLRAQLDAARVSTALQIRGMLTPAQLTKAASVHQQLEALHEQEHAIAGGPDAP